MKLSRFLSLKKQHAALTLVELLVVLSIVAVLSTVAMRSVVGVLDEKNYDANISQLEEIEFAVLGDDETAGFVGDIGRLPEAVGDADYAPDPDIGNFRQLKELWEQGTLPNYKMDSPPGDLEVRLSAGWRGPYLNLGLTRDDVSDGFAKVFRSQQASGAQSDNGQAIAIVLSPGANDVIDSDDSGLDEDVAVFFEADKDAVHTDYPPQDENHWQTPVQVNVKRDDEEEFDTDDAQYLIIRAYGPVNGAAGTSVESVIDLSALDTNNNMLLDGSDSPPQTSTLNFSVLVPHGAKVFRAYLDTSDPADKETPISTTSPERKSPATHVVVDRFTGTITLTLY